MPAKNVEGHTYNRPLLIVVLLVGNFGMMINHTMLATALPDMMKDFNVDAADGQWLTSGFLLMNGILIPIAALLMSKINSRKLYLMSIILLLLGTLLSAVAINFGWLLLGRMIQGTGTGIMIPLMQTIFLLLFPKNKRGFAMGLDGLVIAFGRAVGLTLSGWMVDHFHWRILFWLLIPLLLAVMFLAFTTMRSMIPLNHSRIDYPSIVLSSLGFGALLYGFSSVGNHGWTNVHVIGGLLIGAIFSLLFIMRQLTIKEPILNLTVFRSKMFSLSVIVSGTVMTVITGTELVLPLYIQNSRGESAFFSGLIIMPGAILMGLLSPVTGIIFDKIGARKLVISGMSLLTLGTIPFMFLTMSTTYSEILIFYAVRFLGVAMVMMPMTTAGLNTLPNALISDGTAVNNTVRTIVGSIGTSLIISVMSDVTQSETPEKGMMSNDPSLYHVLKTDAVLNGVNAAFIVAVCFCVLTLALTFFIKESRK
ncbi:DHA2 family efflux MFS transporter permease subunit [Sporolactobacillus kofuensis]|uniref:DHA2 family efflux MFS transporter permease subunit n=1 Tax=Sporolactobacillus kofuensis TaxID=269672 RepID=A0ABW1WGN6_9BACL|nr:DHA2 family efflux MFS transporter permease subunit [Sporolactobacillus kofuensis]MCO7175799.1 DHA2 family efflux MFS transporter permease subunit [Sporolactobacillus kofuensis]